MTLDSETKAVELPEDHGDEIRLWLRLLTCTTLIEGEVRGRLRERFDVTLPRFDLMAQLDKVPEGMTLSDVSKRMMVSNGNVTGLVERLVESGHLDRRTSDADRRVQVIRLTKAGRAEFRKMAAEHETWIADIFGDLAPKDVRELMRLLAKTKGLGAAIREGAATSVTLSEGDPLNASGLRGRIQQSRAGAGKSRDHGRLGQRTPRPIARQHPPLRADPLRSGRAPQDRFLCRRRRRPDRRLHSRRLLAGAGWFVLQPFARGLNAHGIDVAMPSYDLCPAVSIDDIIRQMRSAVARTGKARSAARGQRPFRRRASRGLHAGDRLGAFDPSLPKSW